MATRTLQFYGQGYGATAPTVTASINGTVVFDGPIAGSVDQTPPESFSRADNDLLFTADIERTPGSQTFPMTVTVTGGTAVIFNWIWANWSVVEQANVYTSTGEAIFSGSDGSNDPRSNVTIDGSPRTTPNPRPPGQEGTWAWTVYSGSTMTCDVTIAGAKDTPPWFVPPV